MIVRVLESLPAWVRTLQAPKPRNSKTLSAPGARGSKPGPVARPPKPAPPPHRDEPGAGPRHAPPLSPTRRRPHSNARSKVEAGEHESGSPAGARPERRTPSRPPRGEGPGRSENRYPARPGGLRTPNPEPRHGVRGRRVRDHRGGRDAAMGSQHGLGACPRRASAARALKALPEAGGGSL